MRVLMLLCMLLNYAIFSHTLQTFGLEIATEKFSRTFKFDPKLIIWEVNYSQI